MAIQLEQLAQGFEQLTCLTKDQTVQAALDLMHANDYTQLPVVDDQHRLVGLVSERSILKTLRWSRKDFNAIASLAVSHCLDDATTLSPDEDIFAAIERLEKVTAVVIVDSQRRPIGIVTSYDTGKVLRGVGEVLMVAGDIEERLREYIQRAYATESQRLEALSHVFGEDAREQAKRLTFGDLISIIANKHNWPLFDECLGPKFMFNNHMEAARDVRNAIAHYRRQVDENTDLSVLKGSLRWLSNMKPLPLPRPVEEPTIAIPAIAAVSDETDLSEVGTKYHPLTLWLKERASELALTDPNIPAIRVSFADIERLIQALLPPSAREHRSWWSNDEHHSQAAAWMEARWEVVDVNLSTDEATFEYQWMTDDQLRLSDS